MITLEQIQSKQVYIIIATIITFILLYYLYDHHYPYKYLVFLFAGELLLLGTINKEKFD